MRIFSLQRILWLLLFVVVVFFCSILFLKMLHKGSATIDERGKKMNIEAYSFELPLLYSEGENNLFKLSSIEKKPFLLNFFGSWCVSCNIEHDFLKEYSKSIDIYGIAFHEKSRDAARKWLESRGNVYKKVMIDEDSTTVIAYGVVAAPETFLIDGSGRIVYKVVGILDKDIWKNKILPLIK